MKKLYYIGDVGRPGTAMNIHAQNIARLFRKLGYETLFICRGNSAGLPEKEQQEGFSYLFTKQSITIPKLRAVEMRWEDCFGTKISRLFKKTADKEKPDLVVMYDYSGESQILEYCKRNNIPFVLERVDWFDKETYSIIEKHTVYPMEENCKKSIDFGTDGVIAISSFLFDYYNKAGMNVLQIPPIFYQDWNKEIKRYGPMLRLVYAGSLGSGMKDQILPMIRAVAKVNTEEKRILFDLVGISETELEKATGESNWGEQGIILHGRLSHDETLKIVEKADFGVLLRRNMRYAKAGFSTKFAECMSNGVAMICTIVGGADLMVKHGINGILLPDNQETTLTQSLWSLIAMSDEEILAIRKNAYNTAKIAFNPDTYVEKLKAFIATAYQNSCLND